MGSAIELTAAIIKTAVERDIDESNPPDVRELALMCYTESRRTRSTWMLTREDDPARFQVGTAALLVLASDDDRVRLERELKPLQAISAAVEGVPVDFGALDMPEPDEVIGLLNLYKESAERVEPHER